MEVVALRRAWLPCVLAALMLAVAYGIVGRISLWLALPTGYATVFWPPSGLALAGILIGGPRVWPGIWLGSLMVNIGPAFDSPDAAALLTSAAIAICIGGGAAGQAMVGASLVRRCVGFPNALTHGREIVAFFALGGPVGCLISATVGVTTLAISGWLPWEMYPIQWGTWWIGDILGVLVFAPLVLSWLAEPREIWRRRRVSVAVPLVGALALAVIIFGYARAQEWYRLHFIFEGQAKDWAQSIRTRLDDYLEVLHGIGSFYATPSEMREQALHRFVQRSFARRLALQAVVWEPHFPCAQQASDDATQGQGYLGFQLVAQNPDGPLTRQVWRSMSIADTSIALYAKSEGELAFDLASAPGYHEALRQARDTGQPTASGRFTLAQSSIRQFGLVVSLPIYDLGLPHATAERPLQSLRGYVTGVFGIEDMVEAALQGMERKDIVLSIEDEMASADQRMLYDGRGRGMAASQSAPARGPGEDPASMHWRTTVELAGRRWGLHFTPTLGYLAARQSLQPWALLGGGLVFTSLLGGFLLIVTGRTTVIASMVDRTAQIEASRRLEAAAEQRRREAEVLAELARSITHGHDVTIVLQQVTDRAKELCNSDGAALALCEPATEVAVIRYWAGTPYRGYHGVRIEPGRGIGGLVLATGCPFRTVHSTRDPRLSQEYLPIIQAGHAVGVLVVPIRIADRVSGLLYVGTKQPRRFTGHDEAILQQLADYAAIALHRAHLNAVAEQRRQTAESLAQVGRLLSQSLNSHEVGQQIVDSIQKLLQTRRAVLYQLEPTSGMLVALAARNDFRPAASPWHTLPPGMGAVGLAVRTRQPVVTTDILTDPRITLPAAVRASLEPTPIRAVLALPILRDGLVIGALSIGDKSDRIYDEEAIALARLFADQAATALTNAQLYAEVHSARERLQNLSRQLLEVQEAERRRIAHELHDEAGQMLTSVHLALEDALTRLPPRFRGGFHQVRAHLDDIEAQLRRLSHELRPTILDDFGLLPALQFLVHGVAARTGLDIGMNSSIEGRLAPHIETALYRILQEGITNVTKHAAATHVQLELRRDGPMLHALLQDDGVGFAVHPEVHRKGPRGLGLLGIQERVEALGGTLQIISAPGQGTTLHITLPAETRETSHRAEGT
ncbi:MAG TPA: GAF domain-containing protein [Alphaproteobacteria bacterium]|nr:GAF domain-containing protein [Alphaproteobacteria bacterium]